MTESQLSPFFLGLVGLFTLSVAFVVIKTVRQIALRIGLVDQPSLKDPKAELIPLIGVLSIYTALFAAVFLFTPATEKVRYILAAGLLIVLVGVIDDYRPIRSTIRFAVQILSALVVSLLTGLEISDLGPFLQTESLPLGGWSLAFTVFAVVGMTNAFNLIDGLDGLAGGLCLTALKGILAFQYLNASFKNTESIILLAIALLPYLYYNLFAGKSDKIFLGDAGSTFLGFIVAWTLINQSQDGVVTLSPAATLWCAAVPVIDTFSVMLRRAVQGKSPVAGDYTHIHHLIKRRGLSNRQTLVALLLLSLCLIGIGLLLDHLAPSLTLPAFLALFGAYFVVTLRVTSAAKES